MAWRSCAGVSRASTVSSEEDCSAGDVGLVAWLDRICPHNASSYKAIRAQLRGFALYCGFHVARVSDHIGRPPHREPSDFDIWPTDITGRIEHLDSGDAHGLPLDDWSYHVCARMDVAGGEEDDHARTARYYRSGAALGHPLHTHAYTAAWPIKNAAFRHWHGASRA